MLPGLLIMALRALSMRTGLFTESEKGRQQLVLKRTMGEWILKYGYCLYREEMTMEDHPEQGPTWEWQNSHLDKLFERFGVKYRGDEPGPLRKIPQDALDELKRIFDVTGATDQYEFIEEQSAKKAAEMGLEFDNTTDCGYVNEIYNLDSGIHTKESDDMKIEGKKRLWQEYQKEIATDKFLLCSQLCAGRISFRLLNRSF